MATEVIKIVDPDNGSGTNYTSLSAWEAGEQGDLTGARDEIAVAKCRCTGGTADTTCVYISGWTTDSTRYIKIWTDPSESYRHSGKWETGNKYRIISSGYFGTICNQNSARLDLVIDGLQIENTHNEESGVAACGVFSYREYIFNLTVSHCVIRCGATTPAHSACGIWVHDCPTSGSSTVKIYNNICYGFTGSEDSCGILISCGGGTAPVYVVYNNTFCGNKYNFCLNPNWGSPPTFYVKNNIGQSPGTSDYYRNSSDGTWYTSKNISSDTSSWDASYQSKTVSFVDASGRDYHLASSDTEARNNGDNLYNDAQLAFQTDIDGDDRGGSGAQWDIGADEYVAAASSTRVPFRRMNVLLRLCLSVLTLFGRLFR